jgi:hypothetical protein
MRKAGAGISRRPGEEAARARHQQREEGEVARQDLHAGIDAGADRLCHAQQHAAGQRPPQAAEPAHDHRLEGVDEACRPDRRVDVGAHRHEQSGDAHDRQGERHGEGEDVAVVDAHEPRRLAVVGGGAEGAAQLRAVEQQLQRRDDRDRAGEHDQRQPADGELAADTQAGRLQDPGLQLAAVSGEDLEQGILDDDRQPEGHEQRREDVAAQRQVEDPALQGVAQNPHQRHDDQERQDRGHAGALDDRDAQEPGEHDEVAVRDVHQPHDPEDQRQPRGEEGVEAAQQHALQHRVDPLHGLPQIPK